MWSAMAARPDDPVVIRLCQFGCRRANVWIDGMVVESAVVVVRGRGSVTGDAMSQGAEIRQANAVGRKVLELPCHPRRSIV